MGWREAWKLSDVAFAELSFQAIYAFRLGAIPPPGQSATLVPRARRRVAQSKAIIGTVLGLLAIGAAGIVHANPSGGTHLFPQPVPAAVWAGGVLAVLLSLDTAFLWWNGLQILPTLVASAVLPVLEPLPIEARTFRRAAVLVYLRLFDVPALVVLVGTPIAFGAALGPLAGLATAPGAAMSVVFALALSLATGRFFVRRIQGSRGGGGRTLVRWGYLLLWLVPAFAVLGFVAAGSQFFTTLRLVAQAGHTLPGDLLLAAFPFPAALLPVVVARGPAGAGIGVGGLALLAGAVAAYSALALWATLWMVRTVYHLAEVPPLPASAAMAPSYALRPQGPARSVLRKDLRIASRTPAYAFLLLLPILDALGLGIITVADAPAPVAAQALAIAAVTAAALLATFFGPAFFAIEVLAYAYGHTLPLSDRSILVGKVALISSVYLVASGLVLGLTAIRVFQPLLFAAFVLAELPGVAAAGLIELGWLFRRSARKGFALPNLYSGAWTALLAAIPGVVLAGAPLVTYHFAGLGGMAGIAIAELAIGVAYGWGVRSS